MKIKWLSSKKQPNEKATKHCNDKRQIKADLTNLHMSLRATAYGYYWETVPFIFRWRPVIISKATYWFTYTAQRFFFNFILFEGHGMLTIANKSKIQNKINKSWHRGKTVFFLWFLTQMSEISCCSWLKKDLKKAKKIKMKSFTINKNWWSLTTNYPNSVQRDIWNFP